VAASLARLIEGTGWTVTTELDKEAPAGEFAVFLDGERVFSRMEERRLPDPQEIIEVIRTRLFGEPAP
jgi:selT/selW/selH-like putative selenoprotein